MTIPLARTVRKLKHAISRRLPKRRDDSGLTTLEWLLIVAAVAGLAALAVVLVQNVVSDTSEQIAGSSARLTAAKVSAASVEQEAKNADPTDERFNTWAEWENYFTDKCNRIQIVFSDAGITNPTSTFALATGATDPPTVVLLQAGTTAATTAAALVVCTIE